MKSVSDKVASRVFKALLGIGLTGAILTPFAAAGLAGWSAGTAALASWGFAAAVPLAGAGLMGGFVLGAVASPFIAGGALFAATVGWGLTKLTGGLIESLVGSNKNKHPEQRQVETAHSYSSIVSRLGGMKISRLFASAQEPKANNKPQPVFNPSPAFKM